MRESQVEIGQVSASLTTRDVKRKSPATVWKSCSKLEIMWKTFGRKSVRGNNPLQKLLWLHGPGDLTVAPSQAQSLYTTRVCTTTFNIWDGPDFQDRVVNSKTPVVVDFHAQWSGPCKVLGPRLEKMVSEQHGKVVMAKVDIDNYTELTIDYEGPTVPTMLAIKNGDVVDKFVGIKEEDQLEAFLKVLTG
ncbi:thioredoxin, mitochondrial-like [Molossus molossus]|uniref:thioredoxin, mitochondrial-like n=1 Tax=Molossus molossus TaxID=27622 RepID=UPI0017479C69|nr:thioredoxin, mitochondrial-like [Molossus molossus]